MEELEPTPKFLWFLSPSSFLSIAPQNFRVLFCCQSNGHGDIIISSGYALGEKCRNCQHIHDQGDRWSNGNDENHLIKGWLSAAPSSRQRRSNPFAAH